MTRRLSDRARRQLGDTELPPYLAEHVRRSADAGPEGDAYRCLAVAENKLMWDLLDELVNAVRNVGPASFAYDDHRGSAALRGAIARFGEKHLWHRRMDPESMVVMAGAGATLETLFNALCDPGEGVLIPTPTYASYWLDLETRIGVRVVPVPTSDARGFTLTIDDLDVAIERADHPISAVLLTNPANPTGQLLPPDTLATVSEWARSRGLHLVVNELYGLTTFNPERFRSAADILDAPSDDTHLIWGFSKDFSASGLRAGVAVTSNDDVLASMRQHAMFSVVSGDTQHLLTTMLDDTAWLDRYLDTMRMRLAESYRITIEALEQHDFGFVPADGGMFVFADLRRALSQQSWEAEEQLWWQILDSTGINLTPGSACRSPVPGFMRICYATEPPDRLAESLATALSAAG